MASTQDYFISRISTGDVTVTISSAPNPYDIQAQLTEIAGELENVQLPLAVSSAILRDDMQRHFDEEVDPDGNAWVPLDEEYLASKESMGYPSDILHRTGNLEAAATNPEAFKVIGDGLFFDTSGLPSYSLLHQTGHGAENAGVASNHRFAARNEEGYSKREGGAHSGQGIGRGNALPARPFIGMSEEAETQVWEVFDLWFDEATSIAINPNTGVVQAKEGNRFGRKLTRIII